MRFDMFQNAKIGLNVSGLLISSSLFIGCSSGESREHESPSTTDSIRESLVLFEQSKLIAGDAASEDWFGFSVSIDGDTALVGADHDDDGGSESGSAYIFVQNGTTWTQQQKLTAGDAASEDWFGRSVSLKGDTALIGATGEDDNGSFSGAAYVFVRSGSTWSEQQKLTASDGSADDRFGFSVGIDNDTALISALYEDAGGGDTGSVYAFVRTGSTWSEQQKLTADDIAAHDRFGFSVSLHGDTALIGADSNDDQGAESGSAYVFERTGAIWNQQQKLTASDGAAGDRFGFSVDIDGQTALIGSLFDDDDGSQSGSAYVFVHNGALWNEQQKLTAGDAAAGDWFGGSVSVRGDIALVGARQNDDGGNSSGSAYIFSRAGTNWSEQSKLTANDAAVNDQFGVSVSTDGNNAVVGAYQNNQSGAAYVFKLCEKDIGFAGPGTVDLKVCGPSLSSGNISTLEIKGAPNTSGILFAGFGSNPTYVPEIDGTLVPDLFGGPGTLLTFAFTTDSNGQVLLPVPGGSGPLVLYVQAVLTDLSQPNGYAVSNAVQLEFLP